MTSHPSSIFSSERAGAFTVLALVLGFALAALLAGIGLLGVESGLAGRRERHLLDTRLSEVGQPSFDARVVLVGDSTLGNAIDDRLMSELSGLPVTNLALNGAFGFAGTANMIERAAAHPSVETVVVVQALDIITRTPSPLGDLQTRVDDDRSMEEWLELARAYFDWGTVGATLGELWRVASGRSKPVQMAGDYIRQDPDPAALQREIERNQRRPLRPADIDPEAQHDLDRIVAACRAHHLHCVYAHGPMLDEICANSRPFIDRLTDAVRQAGLEVVGGTPMCLPRSALGDTVDHVAPRLRADSTRNYLDLLRPYLPSR